MLAALGALGGFVALWASLRECALGILAGLGGYCAGLGVLLLLWALGWNSREIDDVGTGEVLVWLALLMVGLPALAAWSARHGWSPSRRAWHVAGWTVFVMLLGALCPPFWADTGRTVPEAALRTASGGTRRIPLRSIEIRAVGTASFRTGAHSAGPPDQMTFAVGLKPQPEAVLAGAAVTWRPLSLRLTRDSGRSVEGQVSPHRKARRTVVLDTRLPDTRLLADLLGPGTMFRNSPSAPEETKPALEMGMLDTSAVEAVRNEPVRLDCTLAGDLHTWEPLADLPLAPDASFRDRAGSWTVLSCRRDESRTEVLLRVAHLQLLLSSDRREARSRFWHYQYVFVLVQPDRREAALPFYPPWPMAQRAWYTASPQQLFLAQFPTSDPDDVAPWSDDDLRRARLRIFRKVYGGAISQECQSPPLRFRPTPASAPPAPARSDTPLSFEELRRRIAALPEPSAASSRAEVGRYLFDVLTLLETALPNRLPYQDPIVERLARLVPAHLALFLEGARPDASSASYVFLEALARGTPADQKEAIYAALPDNPHLRNVLVRRGWLEAAHPAFRKLWESPGALPGITRHTILELRDPASYPRLLEEFVADPSLDFYEALRGLPGIKDQLQAALDRLWAERPRDYASALSGASRLSVLMRAGRLEALEEASRLWSRLTPDRRAHQTPLIEALRDNIASLPSTSPDEAALARWLEGKHADAFRFDPSLRRFVTP